MLEMTGTLWHSSRTADLPFSFHVTICLKQFYVSRWEEAWRKFIAGGSRVGLLPFKFSVPLSCETNIGRE